MCNEELGEYRETPSNIDSRASIQPIGSITCRADQLAQAETSEKHEVEHHVRISTRGKGHVSTFQFKSQCVQRRRSISLAPNFLRPSFVFAAIALNIPLSPTFLLVGSNHNLRNATRPPFFRHFPGYPFYPGRGSTRTKTAKIGAVAEESDSLFLIKIGEFC